MITLQMTEKIAEVAKIDMDEKALAKAREELSKMAGFAKEISEVADSIEVPMDEPECVQRDENRQICKMEADKLSEYGMHIKDGFFRIEAGARK